MVSPFAVSMAAGLSGNIVAQCPGYIISPPPYFWRLPTCCAARPQSRVLDCAGSVLVKYLRRLVRGEEYLAA